MNDERPQYTLYLHNTRMVSEELECLEDQGVDTSEMTERAKERFCPGYEVGIRCIVDLETGQTFAIGIMKGDQLIPLAEQVEV